MAILDTLITRLGFKVDSKGLQEANKKVTAFREGMSNAGNKVAATGAVLTGVLVTLSRTLVDFEKSMNETQAAMGERGTAGAMKLLREEAKKMGAETVFSASQAANAQTELAKAGLSVEENIAALPKVLELAAAGGLSMGEAAQIALSSLNGFGEEVDKAGHFSDVLAVASTSAQTSIGEMGFALSKVAPTAKSLGVSVESTSAALAILQDNGQSAEIAGTGLKGVLAKLVNPSKAASDALADMGISSDKLSEMIGEGNLQGAMELLSGAGLDAASAFKIFGQESASQALILAGSTNRLEELTYSLIASDGAAKEMARTKIQGLPGAIALLTSKVEGAILALGDAGLTDVVIGLADFIGDLVSKFSKAPPFLQKMVIAALALGPALIAVGAAMKAISAGLAIVEGIKAATAAVALFNAVLLANPIGIVIAAVAALGAAIYALWENWDSVVSAFKEGFDVVANFFGGGDGGPVTAPAAAGVSGGSSVTNRSNTVRVGSVNVDARGGDSREIAQNVSASMRDQFQNTVEDFDSGIAR